MIEMVAKPIVQEMDLQLCKKAEEIKLHIVDILVGADESSQAYMDAKLRLCHKLGIFITPLFLQGDQQVIEEEIRRLNDDKEVDGIILERPLPKGLDTRKIEDLICPKKDIDCCTALNMGQLFLGSPIVAPATAEAVMVMLEHYKVDLKGKDVVIVGRSNVVGKPVAMMLMAKNATVQILHTRTKEFEEKTKRADIIIMSAGNPKMLKGDMVKEGAIVIDVGINVDEKGKLCGDVDAEDVKDKVSYLTPVPGGIGPLTNRILLMNGFTLKEKYFNEI